MFYTGEKVRIGFGDDKEILKRSQKIVNRMSQKPSEAIFVYTCSTRKYFMGDEVEAEILHLQQIAPVSGFFTYGEFFTSDHKELFNQTMTLVSLSESEKIHQIPPETESETVDIKSSSIEALIHLVNISSQELQERTETPKENNRLIRQLKERMELALRGSNDGVWGWNILENSIYFPPGGKRCFDIKMKSLSMKYRPGQTVSIQMILKRPGNMSIKMQMVKRGIMKISIV